MEENKQRIVPIIIPTLNRYEHFIDCVESLKKNAFAKYSDLYISVDYPPSEKYIDGNNKIKQYLSNEISEFRKVFIFYQDHNLGMGGNTRFLKEQIDGKYDSYIYSEDDNIFSPNFIEYMVTCLNTFENNDDVVAICGHSLPIDWDSESNVLAFDAWFCAWGYGTWINKNKTIREYIQSGKLDRELRNPFNGIKVFRKSAWAFGVMVWSLDGSLPIFRKNGCFQCVDAIHSIYMILHNKKYIMPVKSMVFNNGWDGSGTTNGWGDLYFYNQKEIDCSEHFCLDGIPLCLDNKENYNRFREYYSPHAKFTLGSLISYLLFVILGKHCEKIIYFLKKLKHKIIGR